MMIKFTYCKNFASAETKEVEWNDFASALTRSVEFPSKEASIKRGAFIGGVREDESRGREANVRWRTVATIDYDALAVGIGDVEFALQLSLDCTFLAYSTFRHTPDAPRVRLCVPLERPVSEGEYGAVVDEIVRTVGLGAPDKCSYVMNQLMFLPSHRPGVEPWSLRNDGAAWPVSSVPSVSSVPETNETDGADNGDDLMRLVAAQPLDITEGEVDAALESYEAEGLDYDAWLRVGMALYHQFQGDDDGWLRWLAWSEKSAKHDPRQMRTKWRSFGSGSRERPVTFASVIKLAGGLQRAVEIRPGGETFEALRLRAGAVSSMDEYRSLRNEVREMNDARLPKDMRSIIIGTVHEAWAKGAMIGKREVNAAFKFVGKSARPLGDDDDRPEWLEDWVFCESDSTFERVSVRHSVNAMSWRMMHDRMPEVIAADVDAVTFASTHSRIPTVAGLMYWPGAGEIFLGPDGMRRLNSFADSGVKPCAGLEGDEDGQRVVNLFMAHVRNTVRDERERRILIDFMAFVIQNPGKRVRWALLLHGIEGNGKSYFFNVMQHALGANARVVSTTAIDSGFTGWAEGAILIGVEEIRIAGTNKYAVLDKMKPLITNDTIAVVHKGRDEKAIPNFASYMMMTNHADAIPVGDNDRRYCVITTRHTRKEDLYEQHNGKEGVTAYFNTLFAETTRRADALARMLMDWKISADFHEGGRAPETDGLVAMRSLHVSEERDDLENLIERYACRVIGPDLLDVTELRNMAIMDAEEMPRTKALGHILSDMGYTQIPSRRVKLKDRSNHYVWYRVGRIAPQDAVNTVRRHNEPGSDFDEAAG